MARKCSSCGNNGHNSRTCSGHQHRTVENGGGVRLFGVQLHVGASPSSPAPPAPAPMKKCFSMECLSSSAPAYYAAALAAGASASSSPSPSSSSSLVSVDEAAEKMSNGYLSDGLMGRAQERKKGVPWTEDEHRRFLAGLEKLGKGDWRGISRHFVTTRTPTQVASHAQKYFLRQSSLTQKKRRSSLFDVVEKSESVNHTGVTGGHLRLKDETRSMSETEFPALSLGISSRAKPVAEHHALPPPRMPTLTPPPPRCSAAMSSSSSTSPSLAPRARHPPLMTMMMSSKPPPPVSLLQPPPPPDLELKISTTARQADPAAGRPAPRTPFFGTVRVT